MEEVQPTSVVPVAAPSTVSPVPEIASDEDLLAMKLPENEDCSEMKDFLLDEAPSELLPEELAAMRISMNEVKRRQPVKRPAVSLPGRPEPDQNISPDKKVRYKHAPSLPNSVNSSKVGKVNAVVKVVVGVNSHGEPSSVNLLQSTGNAELDRLFMRWVRENWTFYPAEKDGVPIASKVVVPVRLNID
ncbi:TonB family protein [Bacteroides ovatus]|nr:TonB family protein [Bacteroides ovatus]